eukprot:ctg_1040.g547
MRVDASPARQLLQALGEPQRTFRPVHIAGSKGKGTVAALLTACLHHELGLSVGTYTSPHVERVNERVRLNGVPLDDDALAHALHDALDAAEPLLKQSEPLVSPCRPTWFDVMTAAGFLAIHRAGCTYGVVECGMGGAKDSTNVLGASVCVLTSVTMEHREILGPTLADIAREKAGIAWCDGSVLVCGVHQPELRRVIEETVLDGPGSRGRQVRYAEGTSVLQRNRETVRLVLDALQEQTPEEVLWRRRREPVDWERLEPHVRCMLPGRMEWFRAPLPSSPPSSSLRVLVDGAHVAETVHGLAPHSVAVLAMGYDKNVEAFAQALLRYRPVHLVCTAVGPDPSYLPAAELSARVRASWARDGDDDEARDAGRVPTVETIADPEHALQRALQRAAAAGSSVTCIGSLHLAGRIRRCLREQYGAELLPEKSTREPAPAGTAAA